VKDFLGYENARNKKNAALYTKVMQLAMGGNTAILIGHHLCFESNNDINTENEIPSADTLLFDHDIMKAVFGAERYLSVMQHLAFTHGDNRDLVLQEYLDCITAPEPAAYPASGFDMQAKLEEVG
jgi:hypothetical protein